MREKILYLSCLYQGKTFQIYEHLKNKKPIDDKDVEKCVQRMKDLDINWITKYDPEYPKDLELIKYPPYVIFYKGDISIISNETKVCMTGEIFTGNIYKNILMYVSSLDPKITLVSSFSKFLDKNILKEFMRHKRKAILVAPNGLDQPYFLENVNQNNVLVISKAPPFCNISKRKIFERNQIIAALSNQLVVFSSKAHSGIHNIVNCFLDMGKDIFVNTPVYDNDGNSILLEQGAPLLQ